jgi:hypothetical protein
MSPCDRLQAVLAIVEAHARTARTCQQRLEDVAKNSHQRLTEALARSGRPVEACSPSPGHQLCSRRSAAAPGGQPAPNPGGGDPGCRIFSHGDTGRRGCSAGPSRGDRTRPVSVRISLRSYITMSKP